jgi:hypothetical protein
MRSMKALRVRYDPHGGRAIGAREMLNSSVAEYGGEMLYVNKGARIPLWAMEYSRDEGQRLYWDDFSPPFQKDGDGGWLDIERPGGTTLLFFPMILPERRRTGYPQEQSPMHIQTFRNTPNPAYYRSSRELSPGAFVPVNGSESNHYVCLTFPIASDYLSMHSQVR